MLYANLRLCEPYIIYKNTVISSMKMVNLLFYKFSLYSGNKIFQNYYLKPLIFVYTI